MKFTNLTRHNEIGANSYWLELDGVQLLLDAGMHPKHFGFDALPDLDRIPEGALDAIFLTHAHLDHAGSIPLAMRHQVNAPVFMTHPTAALAEAMMHNSVNVMESQAQEMNLADYPLFTHHELDRLTTRWVGCDYEKRISVDDEGRVRASFYHAGHILGAAGVLLEGAGKRILYTGDVNFEDQTLTSRAQLPEDQIDVLIIETTRGASPRDPEYTRAKEEASFLAAIKACLEQGGSVLIPVFAMGKTQEVLCMLHRFKQEGRLPDVPLHIGGLSTKMTYIFDDFASSSPRLLPDFRIMREVDLQMGSRNRKKRKELKYLPGRIYALSSGMMSEKTVSNSFAFQFIDNPANSLLFVGYADASTPGGVIRASKPGDLITLDPEMPPVPLECEVRSFDFSGHSTRDDILGYIKRVNPKQCILVHGDAPALEWFQQELNRECPQMEVIIPEPGKTYEMK